MYKTAALIHGASCCSCATRGSLMPGSIRVISSAIRFARCNSASIYLRSSLPSHSEAVARRPYSISTTLAKKYRQSNIETSAMDDLDGTLIRKPKKLIICCDGTWMNSDNGFESGSWLTGSSGHLQVPSNVTRIGRAILPEDKNHHPQIVYYQAGVGTGLTFSDHLIGGGTGEGISEHIREAYSFIANNYTEGDSIFLIGFSRGAFTARSVAGLIGGFGLLEKDALPFFYDIFKDWENAGVPKYRPQILTRATESQAQGTPLEGLTLHSTPKDFASYLKEYKTALLERGLSRQVFIEAVAVWDTVGALGIPTLPILKKIGFPDFFKEYKFFDTGIDDHILHAFQALALDERRAAYAPTIWEKSLGAKTSLKQVWFPGVHSNVGGSYEDTGVADISLAWMMSQLSQWIEFKPGYLREQRRLNQDFNQKLKPPLDRGWGMGRIYDSAVFPTSMAGVISRMPHLYHGIDYFTGGKNLHPLQNTCEFVHASVRLRRELDGKSYEDTSVYRPAGLQDWELKVDEERYHDSPTATNGATKNSPKKRVKWVYNGKNPSGYHDPETRQDPKVMYEDEMGEFELELLEMDSVASAKVLAA